MRITCSSLIVGLAGIFLAIGPASGFEPGLGGSAGTLRSWHKEDGLLADAVTAIYQTRDGFLWIGTSAGLARFDGTNFTEVRLATPLTNTALWVTALAEDAVGQLWIGTQGGLFQLERGRLHQYTKTNGLLDSSVTSVAADTHGSIWIGTKSGLNLFSGKEFRSFTVRDGLPDEEVTGVHVARSGTVWITTRRGGMCQFVSGHLARYELDTGSQGRSPEYLGAYEDRRGNVWAYGDTYLINLAPEGKRFNYFRGNEAAAVRIWSMCDGRDERLWIATTGRGLFCIENDRFQPVTLDESQAYDVRAIFEDREGNLWLGTAGEGLLQWQPQPVRVLKDGRGLPSGAPTALALDKSGRLLVGLGRSGLYVGDEGRFERLGGANRAKVEDFISSICVSRDEAVWAGTLGGGLYGLRNGRKIQFTTANGLADDSILSVCADKEGNVWAGAGTGIVHRFTGENSERYDAAAGLTGSPVTVIIPAASGGIWLGTEDGSILRRRQGEFTIAQPAEKLGRRPILALQEGESGRLWIGTAGAGLACLVKGALATWTVRNGLPTNVVAGVVQDSGGNLWLATGAGIYQAASNAVQMAIEDAQAPLVCKLVSDAKMTFDSTSFFGGTRALASPDGTLWFATSEGLLNVNTRRREIESSPLPVYIESVAFNDQPSLSGLRGAAWSEAGQDDPPAIVPGDLQSLEVHFTALNYAAPEKIRFRHKLEGSDSGWVDDGAARSFHYGRLPYGDYRLRVAARSSDGDWQEAAAPFAFVVPTPLYFQAWAILLYIVFAVAMVAAVVRVVSHRRLRFALAKAEQQQSLERERLRIARDMHDEIGSKLTKLSFLSERAQIDANASGPLASKLEAIAGTSRELLQTMDEIVWVVNPRNDTLEHLAAYLSHYASEYFQNTAIECDIRLPRTVPDHPLSSEARHNLFLAFEEALNNVLKHAAATTVKIEMTLKQPGFEIAVGDNGRGFVVPPTSPVQARNLRDGRTGNGLKNMRQRLADIGGECVIQSQPGNGATVALRIRLNNGSGLQK